MNASASSRKDDEPLERFKPTTGVGVGWSGLALALLAIVWVVLNEHSVLGLRVGLGAAFGAVVLWVTQFRPRVTAYPARLLMRGSVRDTHVPLVVVDEVAMGQTLNIWVGSRRYVCIGIGRSVGSEMRQKARSMGSGSLLGPNRMHQFAGRSDETDARPAGMAYSTFVLNRITDLVAQARNVEPPVEGATRPEVRQEYAVLEIVALALTGAAFLTSFLL